MAQLPTLEDKVRMALDIYLNFGTRPGEGLMPHNFMAVAAKRGWRMEEVGDGLAECKARGWVTEGERGVMLTDAGFAAL